jgi:hypothetical protein
LTNEQVGQVVTTLEARCPASLAEVVCLIFQSSFNTVSCHANLSIHCLLLFMSGRGQFGH